MAEISRCHGSFDAGRGGGVSEMSPLERFFEELERKECENGELLLELRSHLEESALAYEELGMSREEAEEEAIRSLGRKEAERVVSENGRRPLVTLRTKGQEGLVGRAMGVLVFVMGLVVFGPQWVATPFLIFLAIVAIWTVMGGLRRKVAASWHIPLGVYAGFFLFLIVANGLFAFNPGRAVGLWEVEREFESRWNDHLPYAMVMEDEGRFWDVYRLGGGVEAVRAASGTAEYPLPMFPIHEGPDRVWTTDAVVAERQWAEKLRRMPKLTEAQYDDLYSAEGEYRKLRSQFDMENSYGFRLAETTQAYWQLPFVFALIGLGANLMGAFAGRIIEICDRRRMKPLK